jgi:hypothetical protein
MYNTAQDYRCLVLLIHPDNRIITRIPCKTIERGYELIKFEIPLRYNMFITQDEFDRGVKEFTYTNIAYFKDFYSKYRLGLIRLQC